MCRVQCVPNVESIRSGRNQQEGSVQSVVMNVSANEGKGGNGKKCSNGLFTSEEDKRIIAGILESRGYEKHRNGTYGRK